MSDSPYAFEATLIGLENSEACFLYVPLDVKACFGSRGIIPIKANIEGESYRGSLCCMEKGKPHMLIVVKEIRSKIQKNPGDSIKVILAKDTEPREVILPEDFAALLSENPDAQDFFTKLSYTNQKEYALWITSAKRAETRQKRLAASLEKLVQKKRNPSEK